MIRKLLNSFLLYLNWFALEVRAAVPYRRRKSDRSARRVLLVVDQFPPAISGGVYRPLSFAKYGVELGWEMTVVVSRAPSKVGPVGAELRRAVPSQVEVSDLAIVEPPIALRLIPRLDGGFYAAIRTTRAALKRTPEDTAVIVASGPSFHTFVSAFFLKRILGVPLVLDYRDEWTECPFEFVRAGRFDLWWERRCLAASDLVVFTTPSMMTQAQARFPQLGRTRVVVVENGVAFDAFDSQGMGAPPRGSASTGPTTISFVGNLANHTSPVSFLDALGAILDRREDLRRRLKVVWVGNKSPEAEAALRSFRYHDVFESVEQRLQRDAFILMQRSDLLLLLVNRDMDRYRPGKLYDYLATDVPILVYGSRGEAGSIVERLNAGFVVPEGDHRALERILDEAVEGKGPSWDRTQREHWIQQHDRKLLAKRLFEALDGLSRA